MYGKIVLHPALVASDHLQISLGLHETISVENNHIFKKYFNDKFEIQ